jgi:hypothetical protein
MFQRFQKQRSLNSWYPHAISTPEQIMQRLHSGAPLNAAALLREFAEPQSALILLNKIINNHAHTLPPPQYCRPF